MCMHHMLNPRAYSFQPHVRSGMHIQAATTMPEPFAHGTVPMTFLALSCCSQMRFLPLTSSFTCRVGSWTDHSSIERVERLWLIIRTYSCTYNCHPFHMSFTIIYLDTSLESNESIKDALGPSQVASHPVPNGQRLQAAGWRIPYKYDYQWRFLAGKIEVNSWDFPARHVFVCNIGVYWS